MLLQMSLFQPNLLSIFGFVGILLFTSINSVHNVDQEGFRCVNVTKEQVVDYLYKNCHLNRRDFEPKGKPVTDGILQITIQRLQRIYNLNPTGFLNNETCQVIHQTFFNPVPIFKQKQRRRRYAFKGYKFYKNNITYWYKLGWPSGDWHNTAVRNIIKKAFSLWSEVSPLTFRRNPYFYAADIKISFARGYHRDNRNFDGPGGSVAHAHPPGNHSGAEIHFDLDENWNFREGNRDGYISLLNVMLHEIGHALGLAHTNGPGAVLFRIQNGVEQLCEDDINAIQALYEGSRWKNNFWINSNDNNIPSVTMI